MNTKLNKVKTFVRIKRSTLDSIFKGFEQRKANEPNFKYAIPNEETIIEFNDSAVGPGVDENGTRDYNSRPFACYDEKTNVLMIQ